MLDVDAEVILYLNLSIRMAFCLIWLYCGEIQWMQLGADLNQSIAVIMVTLVNYWLYNLFSVNQCMREGWIAEEFFLGLFHPPLQGFSNYSVRACLHAFILPSAEGHYCNACQHVQGQRHLLLSCPRLRHRQSLSPQFFVMGLSVSLNGRSYPVVWTMISRPFFISRGYVNSLSLSCSRS